MDYQTCDKVLTTCCNIDLISCYRLTALCCQPCNSLIIPHTACSRLVAITWYKLCEDILSTACEQTCYNLFTGLLQLVCFYVCALAEIPVVMHCTFCRWKQFFITNVLHKKFVWNMKIYLCKYSPNKMHGIVSIVQNFVLMLNKICLIQSFCKPKMVDLRRYCIV